jgi:hypothetical protein
VPPKKKKIPEKKIYKVNFLVSVREKKQILSLFKQGKVFKKGGGVFKYSTFLKKQPLSD